MLALGGRRRLERRLLRGRLRLPSSYARRLADVEATHKELGREARAYQNPALKYAELPGALAQPGLVSWGWLGRRRRC